MSKKYWHPKEDAFSDFCDQVSTRETNSNPRFVLSDYGQKLLAHVAENEARSENNLHDTYGAWQFIRGILGLDSEFSSIAIEIFNRDYPASTFFSIDAKRRFSTSHMVGIFHTLDVAKVLDQSGSIFNRERGYIESARKRARIEPARGDVAVVKYQEVRNNLIRGTAKKLPTSVILKS